jgi:hypothetical protein
VATSTAAPADKEGTDHTPGLLWRQIEQAHPCSGVGSIREPGLSFPAHAGATDRERDSAPE